jgi:GxxExxY protein
MKGPAFARLRLAGAENAKNTIAILNIASILRLLRVFFLRFLRLNTNLANLLNYPTTFTPSEPTSEDCPGFLQSHNFSYFRLSLNCYTDSLSLPITANTMSENEISYRIIGCALKIHQKLGPGLLESAYEACLYYELLKAELVTERQKPIPLIYEQVKLDCGYRADLVVEKKIVIEVKAVEALNEIHLMQTLTHIKILDYRLGLLINFNVLRLPDGIKRVANNFIDDRA